MTAALLRMDLRRVVRDPVLLFFVAVLPLACYLGFGLALPLDSVPGVDPTLQPLHRGLAGDGGRGRRGAVGPSPTMRPERSSVGSTPGTESSGRASPKPR